MMRIRLLSLLFCVVLAACAADGGPVGSGISSSISGNVVFIDSSTNAATARANAAVLAPVQVSIDEFPDISATTDADGAFELDGDFSGQITLRFTTAQVNAAQPLDVPAGSTTVLSDIVLHAQTVRFGGARQLGFFGHVALTDCTDDIVLVNDRRPTADQFLIHLVPQQTVISDAHGQALQCADLHPGDPVGIDGVIQLSNLTINAISITVAPPPPGGPPAVRELRFVGTVGFINCESGMLVNEVSGTIRIRVLPTTVIEDLHHQPLQCDDIQVGDTVDGQGRIKVRNPDVVDAITITVTPGVGL